MTHTDRATDRLPDTGAGFVWEAGPVPLLRPDSDGVDAAFTTRVGGCSEGAYGSLNLSYSVGDRVERVTENRRRVGEAIGRRQRWAKVRQVHGAGVVRAQLDGDYEADAVWTDDPLDVLCVKAADCVPVLLTSPGRVACVHAGWRGLVAGVVETGGRAIEAEAAWIGPGIGPCCFEVSEDVANVFASSFGDAVVASRRYVDLWAATEVAAARAGVGRIRSMRSCTACHPGVFYSHRRDRGVTGRQGLVAALRR